VSNYVSADETAKLLRISRQLDLSEARAYLAEPGHISMLEVRRLAFDPVTESAEQREHRRRCGRCQRMIAHIREAIAHPNAFELAAAAEGKLAADRAEEIRRHLEVDRCRSCQLRLRLSPKVAACRMLIAAGRPLAAPVRTRPILSTFAVVPVGLRSADSTATLDAEAIDREHAISARLWQVGTDGLELIVHATDPAYAGECLPVELVGPRDSWQGEITLDEQDASGCIGRRIIGTINDVLPGLIGDSGQGVALTVSLPSPSPHNAGANADITGTSPEIIAGLAARLADSGQDQADVLAAIQAIETLGPSAPASELVGPLGRLLEHDEPEVAEAAARALGALAA
jgi:hypothetical protein